MPISVQTNYPIAYDSPDHLIPEGTKNDNNTDFGFIADVERYFGGLIRFMDLGCSGGQLVKDFLDRGHLSVGLEGSDYSIRHARANWPGLNGKALFTCDVSRPYTVSDENGRILFDCITAWEVIEHIHPDRLDCFFKNILEHMHERSIFCGSIWLGHHPKHDTWHQSAFPLEVWNDLLGKHFQDVNPVPITSWVRDCGKVTKRICVRKR
jgi:SAM-dependent methyltransferase